MKRGVRAIWLAIGLVVVLAAAAAWPVRTYLASERVIHRRYPVRAEPLPATGIAQVREGGRLARVYGCTSCHARDLRGEDFPHPAPFAHVHAANLTLRAKSYSDADIARIVRRGVRPDGRSVWFMPANAFVHMNDADVAAIAAYIRTLPAGGGGPRLLDYGWEGRRQIASGAFAPDVDLVRDAAAKWPVDLGPGLARGRYLASVACSECHGATLEGDPGGRPPDLRIVAGYGLEDFRHFMRTGKAMGGRELVMMSGAARERFSQFTDPEIDALHAYLTARANAPERSAAKP
jgi:cytochrome c553